MISASVASRGVEVAAPARGTPLRCPWSAAGSAAAALAAPCRVSFSTFAIAAGCRSVPIVRSTSSAWLFMSPAVSSSPRPAPSRASACRRKVAPPCSSRSKTALDGSEKLTRQLPLQPAFTLDDLLDQLQLARHRLQQLARNVGACGDGSPDATKESISLCPHGSARPPSSAPGITLLAHDGIGNPRAPRMLSRARQPRRSTPVIVQRVR
jgi:hypothetical protein